MDIYHSSRSLTSPKLCSCWMDGIASNQHYGLDWLGIRVLAGWEQRQHKWYKQPMEHIPRSWAPPGIPSVPDTIQTCCINKGSSRHDIYQVNDQGWLTRMDGHTEAILGKLRWLDMIQRQFRGRGSVPQVRWSDSDKLEVIAQHDGKILAETSCNFHIRKLVNCWNSQPTDIMDTLKDNPDTQNQFHKGFYLKVIPSVYIAAMRCRIQWAEWTLEGKLTLGWAVTHLIRKACCMDSMHTWHQLRLHMNYEMDAIHLFNHKVFHFIDYLVFHLSFGKAFAVPHLCMRGSVEYCITYIEISLFGAYLIIGTSDSSYCSFYLVICWVTYKCETGTWYHQCAYIS